VIQFRCFGFCNSALQILAGCTTSCTFGIGHSMLMERNASFSCTLRVLGVMVMLMESNWSWRCSSSRALALCVNSDLITTAISVCFNHLPSAWFQPMLAGSGIWASSREFRPQVLHYREKLVNNREQWNWLFWWNCNLSDFLCACLYSSPSADLLGTFDIYISS
jgi:hypothetical protein